jgi:hypothetical protein
MEHGGYSEYLCSLASMAMPEMPVAQEELTHVYPQALTPSTSICE